MWSLTKGLEFEDRPGLVVPARTGGGVPDEGFLHPVLAGVPIVGLFGLGGHDNSDSCPDHLIVRPPQPLNTGLPF